MVSHPRKFKIADHNLRLPVLAAAFALAALTPAQADEFHLASGKIVRGAVLSQTDTQYVLQTEIGTIKVSKSDVTRVVDQGTTPIEIQGDIAVKDGDYANARTLYSQALSQAVAGSVAAQRIQEKLNKLTSTTQQLASNQVLAQFQQAQALVESGRYDTAGTVLEELKSRISPSDPFTTEILKIQARIHYGKGMAALDAVKLETAQQELEAAIAADPTFYPAYLSLGDSLLGNSATIARGTELIEKGLEVAGDRISEQQKYAYQYKLAEKYFEQKDYAQAAATFAALIPARDKYPVFADALDRAVESYVRMGEENLSSDFRETITNLNNALRLNPSNQKALFLLGRIYLDLGQVENAIVSLSRLVELKPSYEEANHYLGRAYFQAHDNDAALRHLSIEIANNPDSYFTLVDRAEVHIEEGNTEAAQADLQKAKLLDPAHWRSYYLTGLLAFNEENYEQARTALMEALDRKRTAMPAHLLMGRVLIEQNQLEGARQWLQQVADRLENVENMSYAFKLYRADALTQLGDIALQENSPRQAENYLSEALVLAPDYAPALSMLADTKLMLAGDAYVSASKEQLYQEAESLYLQAIEKNPDNPENYSKLGRFYQRYANDNNKAIEYFNLYADKGGTDSRVNVWLVEAGGTARPELAVTTVSTAGLTTGSMLTTATATLTTGPMGTVISATTATAVTAQPGVVLPVDAMMAQTTAAEAMATVTATTVAPRGNAAVPPGAATPPAGAPAFPTPPPAAPVAPQ